MISTVAVSRQVWGSRMCHTLHSKTSPAGMAPPGKGWATLPAVVSLPGNSTWPATAACRATAAVAVDWSAADALDQDTDLVGGAVAQGFVGTHDPVAAVGAEAHRVASALDARDFEVALRGGADLGVELVDVLDEGGVAGGDDLEGAVANGGRAFELHGIAVGGPELGPRHAHGALVDGLETSVCYVERAGGQHGLVGVGILVEGDGGDGAGGADDAGLGGLGDEVVGAQGDEGAGALLDRRGHEGAFVHGAGGVPRQTLMEAGAQGRAGEDGGVGAAPAHDHVGARFERLREGLDPHHRDDVGAAVDGLVSQRGDRPHRRDLALGELRLQVGLVDLAPQEQQAGS